MQPTSTKTKQQRLEARVTADQKELFQRAADLEGRSLTDFVISSLQSSAEDVIERHQQIVLSSEASQDFVRALLDPGKPSPALERAVKRYRAFLADESS